MNPFRHLVFFVASACLLGLAACSSDSKVSVNDTAPSEVAKPPFNPTIARTPAPSKALSLTADWQAPARLRERAARKAERVQPRKAFGISLKPLSRSPSDAELRAFARFGEPLRPVPGVSSPEETEALASALKEDVPDDREVEELEHFLGTHPQSRWAPVLHLNVASISYTTGYFQQALAHWKAAWELTKDAKDLVSVDIANLALGEYAKMNGRIGRMSELEALLGEAQKRNVTGDARGKIDGAGQALWFMQHEPGVSFQCGPQAVLSVAVLADPKVAQKTVSFLRRHPSPPTGFSIPEVQRMSVELGLKLQLAKREPGAAAIVPAIVHWSVNHFGAIIREVENGYLLKDPTFGNQTVLTARALDREASGYFLVPEGPLPSGWRRASTKETAHLFGRGYTNNIDPNPTSPNDPHAGGGSPHCSGGGCCGGGGGGGGGGGDDDDDDDDDGGGGGGGGGGGPSFPGLPLQMATYSFHILAASLHIEDTPVQYPKSIGPKVSVRVAYNQREADQPTTIDFTSFGPQFVSNWVSYLTDNTSSPSADITLRKRGGGGEVQSDFNSTSQSFAMDRTTSSVLTRLTANTYKKVYRSGRQEYYEQYIGTSGTQRRVFLSRVVDPQGKEVTVDYDSTYPSRIHQIVDATGLPTVFHYDYSGEPYLVTSIEDPYGRESTFAYTSSAGALRLQSIEDPYGTVSSFTYSAAGEIVAMATPYGTTAFGLSDPYVDVAQGLFRYVEATDPLGQTERLEYNVNSDVTGVTTALETPWPSSSVVDYSTNYNHYRNSFFWDKLATKLARGDYAKAHRYHWLHSSNGSASVSILESEVPPLEGRIFYNYPGQTSPPIYVGTTGRPSVVARVVKDATGADQTQATKYEYNTQGNVTKVTDPMGRETLREYDTNGVDVVAVKRRTGTSGGLPVWTTTATFAYASGTPPHRPSSITDGAGQSTTFTYTSEGQIATITNAKSEVTTYTYETSSSSAAYGRVLSITGDVAGGNRTFTYDSYGRLLTSTDSEGYVLTYSYDSLDRVRTITYPDSSFEEFDYEDHSLVASRDREGRWTRHMYNGLMQRVLTRDPAQRTTQFEWCRCGKLRRFVDGNGNITEWQRDEAARVVKKIDAAGNFSTYAYDQSGRLHVETDPMARTTTYSYNVDDRLAKKDYSDSATPDVMYSYDTWFPRVTSRVDGAGTTTFAYHPYGTSTLGGTCQRV